MDKNYDSSADTLNHKDRVAILTMNFINLLHNRAMLHDNSKLESKEKPIFDEYTPKLKNSTYGSEEYKEFLSGMKVALDNHYKHNSHHPEHYVNGINGMDLLDIVEMFFDWKAASERHDNGDIYKSIDINEKRFKMSEQLKNIFINTAKNLNY